MKNNTFSSALNNLSKKAFAAMKAALVKLDNECLLPETINLYIDTCNDSGFLHTLKAKKVLLRDGHIIILSEEALPRQDEILSPTFDTDIQPDECWCEDGEWNVEWEGLLEVFDLVLSEVGKTLPA